MDHKKPLVISILGPTASGKTNLAIELAEFFELNINNVDSRQMYFGMDIGTAKPTKAQQKRIRHHLVDIAYPNNPLTIHEFREKATQSLSQSFRSKNMGLLVGGSGLYIKSITHGLQPPAVSAQNFLRNQFEKIEQFERHQILSCCDPISAKKISQSDSSRTIRALEVFYTTGLPISSQQTLKPPKWHLLELGLNPSDLDQRIISRTKDMYKNGLVKETKKLINRYGECLPLLKTIGYEEALCIIKGTMKTPEAIAITTQRTKKFAKRQRTWFKNQHSPIWLNDQNPFDESKNLIQKAIRLIK